MFSFGDHKVVEVHNYFQELLEKMIVTHRCHMVLVLCKLVKNSEHAKYLDTCEKIFKNETKSVCWNTLYIFEIMLVTPFTNARVECIF